MSLTPLIHEDAASGGDELCGGRVAKALEGRDEMIPRLDLQRAVGAVAVEQAKRERMQHGEIGHVGIAGERVTQGERTVGGQLGQQPVGEIAACVVVILDRLAVAVCGQCV